MTAVFFDRLRSIVDQIHARGIVVCDLRNRKNVMVTNASDPYVIDFCTAFFAKKCCSFPQFLCLLAQKVG